MNGLMKILGCIRWIWLVQILLCVAVQAAAITNDDRNTPAEQTLILSVDGSPVYEAEFRFWFNYATRYYAGAHHMQEITNWSTTEEGMPLRDYLLKVATQYVCNDRALIAKANALGIELTDAEAQAMQAARTDNIKIYGSESEYRRIVESMYGSETVFDHLTQIKYLSERVFTAVYGLNGEQCDADCVAGYIEQQKFMAANYIFLSAANDKQRAQNRRRLTAMLKQLAASDDPQTLFVTLMESHSQDTSLANYPDGRLFAAGTQSDEFERAYLKLAVDQHSGVVSTKQGDYLIMRLPIFADMVADEAGHSLHYWVAHEVLFKNLIGDECARLSIVYQDGYFRFAQ